MEDSNMAGSASVASSSPTNAPGLKRALGLWGLVLYGIIVTQPIAAMSPYGLVSAHAHGHVVTGLLLAMVAMVFTALSYGRMARAYPSAGSAYTYVTNEIHPVPGYVTGLSMALDYILNPLICTILASKLMLNYLPGIPYVAWVFVFAALYTALNLVGIKTSAKINAVLAGLMGGVIVVVIVAAARFILKMPALAPGALLRPFYDPATFNFKDVMEGTSLSVLTFIGFDGISTLSEEVENPRRNVLLATVLTCVATGIIGALYVYPAQLVWPESTFPDPDTAYVFVAERMGGTILAGIVNATLLVATIGSGIAALLGAARLLYGMGRDNALPKRFFGYVTEGGEPRNNVLLVGAIALVGAFVVKWGYMSFDLAANLLTFGALVAFVGVNAAAFVHYVVRRRERSLSMIVPPVLGFACCGLILRSVSREGIIGGCVWLALGLAYAFYKRSFSLGRLET
jgi:putrescine importer